MKEIQIQLQNISKNYDGRQILKPFDFEIQRGSAIAFVGHNGCGKSTLIKIIAGMIQPTGGKIVYPNGKPLFHYLPEKFYPTPLKPFAYLRRMGELDSMNKQETEHRIQRLADDFYVTEFLHVPMKSLSKGTLQKIGVIQALLHKPDVMLLDEPLSGQDEVSKKVFIRKINQLREDGVTVIMSCHEQSLTDAITEKQYTIKNGVFQECRAQSDRLYCVLVEKAGINHVPDGMERYGRGFRLFISEQEADRKIKSLLDAGWSIKGMYYEQDVEHREI